VAYKGGGEGIYLFDENLVRVAPHRTSLLRTIAHFFLEDSKESEIAPERGDFNGM